MPGEFFFMAIGGLGVSIAGFAGLIAAFDRRPAKSPVSSWRIKNIVAGGFFVTFSGFSVIAAHSLTGGDVELTISIIGGVLGIFVLVRGYISTRPGPAWPSPRGRSIAMAFVVGDAVAYLLAATTAHLGLLQLGFLIQLSDPASIFFNTVREVAGSPRTS